MMFRQHADFCLRFEDAVAVLKTPNHTSHTYRDRDRRSTLAACNATCLGTARTLLLAHPHRTKLFKTQLFRFLSFSRHVQRPLPSFMRGNFLYSSVQVRLSLFDSYMVISEVEVPGWKLSGGSLLNSGGLVSSGERR